MPRMTTSRSSVERVNVVSGVVPDDYHCACEYCSRAIGELRPASGGYYSRLERNKYYDPSERGDGGHIAKTPLHVARWAVQAYTGVGDWVVDPTIGAGTTAVEALTQERNAAGMEIQFADVLEANVRRHATRDRAAILRIGDARRIAEFFREERVPRPTLVVNNPPYSGDEGYDGKVGKEYHYDRSIPNLGLLRESDEYWSAIRSIYSACAGHLLPGGRFVVAVKDMMRNKVPYMLHREYCRVLTDLGLSLVGTAFLHHYPRTLFMNTYFDRYGVHPPYYQTISVFQKTGGDR